MVQGTWYHDEDAAATLGIQPATDPEPDIDTDGNFSGGYPTGITTRQLVFVGPPGDAQTWGMAFGDAGETVRDGNTGDGQVWFMLRSDPACSAGPGGAAEGGGNVPPPPVAGNGPGAWPVPLDTPITRGFGCHSFYSAPRYAM
jgi:hypothetical protein